MRWAKPNTRCMSCSISSTVTSPGSAAIVVKSSRRSFSVTPAAGSSSSSSLGRHPIASAISSSRCLPYGSVAVRWSMTSASWKRSANAATSSTIVRFLPATRHQLLPTPARSDTTRPSDSNGVSSAKSWLIWNVRAMPSRARSYALRSVMSRPTSRMRPAVGARTPLIRLTTVVLPAPFGPINAWRAPCTSSSETSRAAVMPPKRICSPNVWRTMFMVSPHRPSRGARGGGRSARRPRPIAAWPFSPEHDQHQHQSDPELPILRREIDQRVLHQLEDRGPDQPAIEIAGPAQDQHEQHVGRSFEREHVERGELRSLREQRAGDARVSGGDGVNRDEPRIDADADGGSAQRIAFDRTQRQPEGRIHETPRRKKRQKQHCQAVDIGDMPGDIQREDAQHGPDHDALQAVGAAGQPVEPVGDLPQNQSDAERHHQPGQVGTAQQQKARHESERRGGEPGGEQRQHGFGDERIGGQQPGRVGSQAEERRMAERQDPGVSQNEIEREREQSQDGDFGEDQMPARQQKDARQRGEPEHDFEQAPARARRKLPGDLRGERHGRRAFSLPPRSGGEGGEVRSTEPGGGAMRSDSKAPPPLTPPHHSLRSRGEGTPAAAIQSLRVSSYGHAAEQALRPPD